MGILDTMRNAASSIPVPVTAVISGIAAVNPVTAVVAAHVSAANAVESLLSGGSRPSATDTPKTDAPKTQKNADTPTPQPAASNDWYLTYSSVDQSGKQTSQTWMNKDGSQKAFAGIDAAGLASYYAEKGNTEEATKYQDIAKAASQNAVLKSQAGKTGTYYDIQPGVFSRTEEETAKILKTQYPGASVGNTENPSELDLFGGLETLVSLHPIGQLYNAISNLGGSTQGGGITIPTLDEIKKDNPVSNMIEGIISTRDAAYDSGGLAFVPAAAADILLPLDLVNLGNNLFTGKTVTTEDWIYAVIDAFTLAGGAMSLGAGYIPLRALAKTVKVSGKALNVSGILGSLGVLSGGLGGEDPEGGNGGDDDKTANPTLITDPDANGGGVIGMTTKDESIISGLVDTIRGLITIGGSGDTYNSYSSGGGLSGGTTTSTAETTGFTQYIPVLLLAGLGIIAVYAITQRTA